ncbi:MAG: efflux RND transporter periplasmic adaptor subunit [candidate division Zixibacteria bacterium]|nr:efflux RND transporter periplasmic adaptor subunit [candidate division Zixibacteria bacterium]
MKNIFLIVVFLTAVLSACCLLLISAGNAVTVNSEPASRQLYTCGMHPQIISEEPGYCPICGMKLTPKKDGATYSGAVKIDPVTVQNMGIKTTPVALRDLTRTVRMSGKITYSEPHRYAINLKFSGWVERVHVTFEGEKVNAGQLLLEIYSPELVAAQKELLIALKSFPVESSADTSGKSFLEVARKRLKNWDVSDEAIEQLLKNEEVIRTMPIRSPATGIVISCNITAGDYVEAGKELYRIADLSQVWVIARVYEQDFPWIKLQQTASVTVPGLPGQKYTAEVSYVAPFLEAGRQAELRLVLNNKKGLFKPDMYAEVDLHGKSESPRPVVPRSAVINSGVRELVFIDEGEGVYRAREIVTGVAGDSDLVEVLSGLMAGERVVVSGQFLLDSESRLSEAVNRGAPGDNYGKVPSAPAGDRPVFNLSDIYTCPMPEHYHILQYGQGDCPECGMKLVPVEETDNSGFYICPMPEDRVARKEPGRCPVCGMALVKFEKETGYDK